MASKSTKLNAKLLTPASCILLTSCITEMYFSSFLKSGCIALESSERVGIIFFTSSNPSPFPSNIPTTSSAKAFKVISGACCSAMFIPTPCLIKGF